MIRLVIILILLIAVIILAINYYKEHRRAEYLENLQRQRMWSDWEERYETNRTD